MRIALVTSFARGLGGNGEDNAVLDQATMLSQAGHEVLLVSRSTDDEIGSRAYALRAGLTVASGHGPTPLPEIERFEPDVVHVHNTYPNFGRAWARQCNHPLVVTMHSFRFFCASASFFRNGQVCTDCLTAPLSAARHGCYDGRARSLPYSLAGLRRSSDALMAEADRVVVLNSRMRSYLVAAGLDADRVVMGRNTAAAVDEPVATDGDAAQTGRVLGVGNRGAWLYVGRLLEAKGVLRLVRRWPTGVALDLLGDGPAFEQAKRLAGPGVRFLGHRDRSEVRATMASARGLIIPSLMFEGQPLVYIEALAAGLPILAFEPNAAAALVAEEGTGRAVNWTDSLSDVLRGADDYFPDLRQKCLDVFEQRYASQPWLEHIERIYQEAIAHRRRRGAKRPQRWSRRRTPAQPDVG